MIATTVHVAHQLFVGSPNLLYVHTKVIAEQFCMVVYKSVAVKIHHEIYASVAKFLAEHEHEKVVEIEKPDDNMVRRRGIETTYAIFGRKEDPSTHPELGNCA